MAGAFGYPFPLGWYWLADDGRVYSAPLQSVVADQDSGYVAFLESGSFPTRWPEDDQGQQTDASLDEVIVPLGLTRTPAKKG